MSRHGFGVATWSGLLRGHDLNLVSRPGLDMVERPHVATWNRCHDKASPLCVATRDSDVNV